MEVGKDRETGAMGQAERRQRQRQRDGVFEDPSACRKWALCWRRWSKARRRRRSRRSKARRRRRSRRQQLALRGQVCLQPLRKLDPQLRVPRAALS